MGAVINMCDCQDNDQQQEYDQYGNKFKAPQRQSANNHQYDQDNKLSKEEVAQLIFVRGYKQKDGASYSGQMKVITKGSKELKIQHGRGKQIWADGADYEGEWRNGILQGDGIFNHPNGDKYNGSFYQDRANGFGTYLYENGQIYQGHWKDDLHHGEGREELPDGSTYEGMFQDGKRRGHGVYQSVEDNSVYKGQWIDNNIEGQGSCQWPDGRSYEGQWKNNMINGFGTYTWPDGREYKGYYQDDKKQGQGVYSQPDGTVYDGGWKNGKQHGKGIFTNRFGQTREGQWKDGNRVAWTNKDPYGQSDTGAYSNNEIHGEGGQYSQSPSHSKSNR